MTATTRDGPGAGWVLLLPALVFLAAAEPVAAQADPGGRPWVASVSRYGKWVTLAGAAAFATLAISRNDDADEIFRGLITLCRSAPDECRLTSTGRYRGPDAERLYQETLRLDRQARTWMILGQVTLAASGAMFLIDLVTGNEGPKNIPFAGLELVSQPGRLGLGLRF